MNIPLRILDSGLQASLLEDLHFYVPLPPVYGCDSLATADGLGCQIVVPKEFITDFASSPKWAWSFVGPLGRYTAAAILHDYLYAYQVGNRKWADEVFLVMMKKAGVKWLQRNVMWLAVRAFGRKVWDET